MDDVIQALTDALRAERRAADLDGYFGGSGGLREKYEAAQRTTDALVESLR